MTTTRRTLLAAVILLSLALVVALSLAITHRRSLAVADRPQPAAGADITVKLTVSPAAVPDPALKYELIPRLRDKRPGNAADGYNRAFRLIAQTREPGQNIDFETPQSWLRAPREEFPAAEARKLVGRHAEALREVERAALAERCDWNLLARLKADGIKTPLPELQPAREVGHLLALRARLELIDGRVDDSIRTLRTVFQVAKHASEGPTHLHPMVGAAIGSQAAGLVEELVQHPDAPNLYWALAGLPRPFTDPAAALEGDEISFRVMFPTIAEFERGPVSQERADAAVAKFFADLKKVGGDEGANPVDGLVAEFGLEVLVARRHEAAKKELVARGRPVKEVEAMPAKQAVFLASWERYKSLRDEGISRWFRQPYPEALAGLERTHDLFKQAQDDALANQDMFGVPFILLTPAFRKSFDAHVQFERRLAVLRVIEALRLHAAANGGKLPAKLEEVTAVAVPADPATGKPFEYRLTGDTAVLSGPPPQGQPATPQNALRYELTLRR